MIDVVVVVADAASESADLVVTSLAVSAADVASVINFGSSASAVDCIDPRMAVAAANELLQEGIMVVAAD
jgi:hypothetical protein